MKLVSSPMLPQCLYYPSFHFEDVDFLKVQSLYWEHIYRIKPPSLMAPDSEFARALIEADILRDLDPAPFVERASSAFGTFLGNCSQHVKERIHGHSTGYIARLKMDQRLESSLIREGFAEVAGPWLRTDQAFAKYFMFYLANFIGTQRLLCPITDDWQSWGALTYFREGPSLAPCEGRRAERGRAPTQYLVAVMLRELAPENTPDIDVTKLVAFREKHRETRMRYMVSLEEMMACLQDIQAPEAIADLVEAHVKDVEATISELKSALRDIRLASAFSIKTVSVPILATALAGLSGSPWIYISPVVGLAIGIAGAIHQARSTEKAKLAESKYSYLYFMRREASGLRRNWPVDFDTFERIAHFEHSTERWTLTSEMDHAIGDFLYD